MVRSSIKKRDVMPRAESSPRMRQRSDSRSVLGGRGSAYLIERDGYLFESPITWYPQERKWDLSPGYEKSNVHFDRPIQPDCLFCHANRVEPVAGSVNRYRRPIFQDLGIGCERCHGPGALHVLDPVTVDGRDMTIVNPARLELNSPAFRMPSASNAT